MDKALEHLFNKYEIEPNEFDWVLMFNYGKWENIKSTYFEFRFKYMDRNQKIVFKYIDILSDYLKAN